MCCGKRRQRQSQAAPLVATIGKMAYDKYLERKGRSNAYSQGEQQLPAQVRSMLQPSNDDKKVNVDPPSYDEVIVNRTTVPEDDLKLIQDAIDWAVAQRFANGNHRSQGEHGLSGIVEGMQNHHLSAAQHHAPDVQMASRGVCQSRCQQKKAARAAKKAEKWAAKAAATRM